MNEHDVRRRRSIRLASWDYRTRGAYFVTICSYQRELSFRSAEIRRAITTAWARSICGSVTPPPREFVVMPNHVHGIVWLDRNPVGARHPGDRLPIEHEMTPGVPMPLEFRGASPLRPVDALRARGPDRGSLEASIGAFKSAAAKRVNTVRGTPGWPVWHRGYYERIVRDKDELTAIREYIRDNPVKWLLDPNHPINR